MKIQLPFYPAWGINKSVIVEYFNTLGSKEQIRYAILFISSETKELFDPVLNNYKLKIQENRSFLIQAIDDAYKFRNRISSFQLKNWYECLPNKFKVLLLDVLPNQDVATLMLYEENQSIFDKYFDFDMHNYALDKENGYSYYEYKNPLKKKILLSYPTQRSNLMLQYETDAEIIKFAIEKGFFDILQDRPDLDLYNVEIK